MKNSPYRDLLATIESVTDDLAPIADTAMEKLTLSISWVGYHLNNHGDEDTILLLKGAYGSAVEAISLTSFGLIRPAMLSLRSHYELCLQFLYYKDHPREWASLTSYRSQGPLPSVVKKYLKEHSSNFEPRHSKLLKARRRETEEVYGILSGVAHGSALNSISSASKPSDLVEDKLAAKQSLSIFQGVGESISDFYLSDFSSNWISLPEQVRTDAADRFQGKNASKELLF